MKNVKQRQEEKKISPEQAETGNRSKQCQTMTTFSCKASFNRENIYLENWSDLKKMGKHFKHTSKLELRLLICHFFADILSVRGTSWKSVLPCWIWINHQVQRLKPSQTQHTDITAEQQRRPWSALLANTSKHLYSSPTISRNSSSQSQLPINKR